MKNPHEVLNQKEAEQRKAEQELASIRRQVECLKFVLPLLAEESDAKASSEEKPMKEWP